MKVILKKLHGYGILESKEKNLEWQLEDLEGRLKVNIQMIGLKF